jgi:hypothetical protein
MAFPIDVSGATSRNPLTLRHYKQGRQNPSFGYATGIFKIATQAWLASSVAIPAPGARHCILIAFC